MEAMANVVARLLECDEATIRLLRWRFLNPAASLDVYARRNGVSVRTVARRIKAIADAWPEAGRMMGVT
jgi:hypothetical protein